jgi:hypothetical protein
MPSTAMMPVDLVMINLFVYPPGEKADGEQLLDVSRVCGQER